jgi:hypothetical protein
MSGRCDEQDDLTLVYMWARKDADNEIKKLRAENERLRKGANDIWKRNRDRRRAKRARALMSHAENEWRAEIERLRGISNVWTLIAEDDEDYQGRLYVSIGL